MLFYSNKDKAYTLRISDPDTKETNVFKDEDTIFNGKCLQYKRKGAKIAELNFVNGDRCGKSVYYFDNGKIKATHYMKNSKTIMESSLNYFNGKIKKYVLFDDLGKSAFIIYYDTHGNVENYKDLSFIEMYQYKIAHKEQFKTKTDQYLKAVDTLKYKYLLANRPNAKRSFNIEFAVSDNTKRKITKNQPVGIDVKQILTEKGKNAIKAVVEYKFNDNKKTIIKDSVFFEVDVY